MTKMAYVHLRITHKYMQGLGPYIRDIWNALDVLTLSLLYASLAASFRLPETHRAFYFLSGTNELRRASSLSVAFFRE